MLIKNLTLFTLLILALSVYAQNKKNPADNIFGKWMSQEKTGVIEISKRGAKFYGKLVWIRDSIDVGTKHLKKDKQNPITGLRDRYLKGLEILTSFQYVGNNTYKEGEIYDPKEGKTYSCKMTLSENGQSLDIRGFIGISLLGKTETWTRIKEIPK